jgi:hypothetical protein
MINVQCKRGQSQKWRAGDDEKSPDSRIVNLSPIEPKLFVELVKKHDGFLTLGTLRQEFGTSFPLARDTLEEWYNNGEAEKIICGRQTTFYFRVHGRIDEFQNQLIEIFMENTKAWLSRLSLIGGVKMQRAHELDVSLLDLERMGVVSRNPSDGSYLLRLVQDTL